MDELKKFCILDWADQTASEQAEEFGTLVEPARCQLPPDQYPLVAVQPYILPAFWTLNSSPLLFLSEFDCLLAE
jgi:hypothetical protein